MKSNTFHGVYTALVTPMDSKNELDLDSYRKILEDQKSAGVAGVIPCGTTGESPTLTLDEKKTLIQVALEVMEGSPIDVVAGTGSNNTRETVEFSKWASDQGVNGILVVTPYYNKPSQLGLEQHFLAVADAVECPIMLYNVPGRTGCSLAASTIARLSKHPRIRAIKEASGNVPATSEIFDVFQSLGTSLEPFEVLSGDDACFLPLLSVGACGVVSVASNLFPRAMVKIQTLFAEGRNAEALKLHQFYYPLFRDLFIESNPVPIKKAMSLAGWCQDFVRPPLAPLTSASLAQLEKSLARCKISAGEQL
jgi:4-hydroxy-tetrahydrodipicolinate synthase